MSTELKQNLDQNVALSSVLLADMQRCLLWMEHVNRCAEREEKMGHWLCNWPDAMNHWDAEYQKARDRLAPPSPSNDPRSPTGARTTHDY